MLRTHCARLLATPALLLATPAPLPSPLRGMLSPTPFKLLRLTLPVRVAWLASVRACTTLARADARPRCCTHCARPPRHVFRGWYLQWPRFARLTLLTLKYLKSLSRMIVLATDNMITEKLFYISFCHSDRLRSALAPLSLRSCTARKLFAPLSYLHEKGVG